MLAAPCCHHDISAQLRQAPAPAGYAALTRDGILRERLADTLTDALRASILRLVGYRVDVVEFVDSKHTPRNTLLRAVRTGAEPRERAREEYETLTSTWHCVPPSPSCSTGTPAGDPPTAAGRCAARRDRRTSRGGRDDHADEQGSRRVFELRDDRIYESSGLVDLGSLMATVNDSGDTLARLRARPARPARRSASPTSTPR